MFLKAPFWALCYFLSVSRTSLKILMHPFLFSRMTPLYIILPDVLFKYTGCFLKIFPRYTTCQRFGKLTSILLKLPLWQYLTRRISIPPFFNNTHLSETDTHKHLCLIFHHSLSWHAQTLHLHQEVMTKMNRLRLFYNSLPSYSLLTFIAIGKPERHVRKASHCGSKQQ